MKLVFTNMILVFALLFAANMQAQTVDTVKYKSAKDYIKAKEETDSNALKMPKPQIKINCFPPMQEKKACKKRKIKKKSVR